MPRELSSSLTFVYKVLFPAIWIPGFGLGAWLTWQQRVPEFPLFLLAWIVGSAVILALCLPLKRVSADADQLQVSNFLREISLPLRDVVDVTENRWINIHPVTIHLRDERGVAHRVTFMPTTRWFAFWSSHPVVAELRAMAAAARRRQSPQRR